MPPTTTTTTTVTIVGRPTMNPRTMTQLPTQLVEAVCGCQGLLHPVGTRNTKDAEVVSIVIQHSCHGSAAHGGVYVMPGVIERFRPDQVYQP